MKKGLLSEFDYKLDLEAERVIKEMLKLHKNKKEVNKSFNEIAKSLIKPEYKDYWCEISLRMYNFIPKKYTPDLSKKYIFITKEQYRKDHLIKYSEWSKKAGKDYHYISKKICEEIINYCKKNPKSDKSLAELVSKRMKKYFPKHYDSIDARCIILFLEDNFKENGYVVETIEPLRILKNN